MQLILIVSYYLASYCNVDRIWRSEVKADALCLISYLWTHLMWCQGEIFFLSIYQNSKVTPSLVQQNIRYRKEIRSKQNERKKEEDSLKKVNFVKRIDGKGLGQHGIISWRYIFNDWNVSGIFAIAQYIGEKLGRKNIVCS